MLIRLQYQRAPLRPSQACPDFGYRSLQDARASQCDSNPLQQHLFSIDQARSELTQAETRLQGAEGELEVAQRALGPTAAEDAQVLTATAALERVQSAA